MSVFPPPSPSSFTTHRKNSHTIGFGHAKPYNPSSIVNGGQFGFGSTSGHGAFPTMPQNLLTNVSSTASFASTSSSVGMSVGGWRTPFASIGRNSVGWGTSGGHSASTQNVSVSPMGCGSGGGGMKRRRSPSPGRMDSSPGPEEKERRVIKKGRGLVKEGHVQSVSSTATISGSNHVGLMEKKEEEVDLGRAIADLDAQTLRSLVLNLASSNPDIVPQIIHLLPRPTLETLLTHLSSLESTLLQSIPRGNARPEYILGRIRSALQEWSDEVTRICTIGQDWTKSIPSNLNPTTITMNMMNQSERREGREKKEEHPNTIFSLFHSVSLSFIRIHNALPINTTFQIQSVLPSLQSAWKSWLIMVERRLNEGKLVSESMGREWIKKLEELGEGGREVKEQAEKIIGPFIGMRIKSGYMMDLE